MHPSRRLRWLAALLAGGAIAAAVAGALLLGWRAGSTPPRRAEAAKATQIDLGRAICGECCTSRIWRAVGSLPGVADVVATAGNSTIVVHHDGRAGVQQELVDHLVAADFPEASLRGEPDAATPPPRHWVRPVQRPTSRSPQ
jgi:copper chaperone CopZ